MDNISKPIFKEEQVGLPDGLDLAAESLRVSVVEVPTLSPPRRSWYVGLLCFSVFTMVLIGLAVYCMVDCFSHYGGYMQKWEITIYVCAVLTLMIYFIVVVTESTMEYLGNIRSSAELMDYFTELKKRQPQMQVISTCFHWETTYRTCFCFTQKKLTPEPIQRYSRYDPVSELVITEKNTTDIKFTCVMDLSGVIPEEMLESNFVKVKFIKDLSLSNSETVTTILDELKNSNERDQKKDLNHSLNIDYKIEGCEDKIMVISPADRRFYISQWFYFLVSCLFLAAPYSIWLDRITNRADIKIKKLLTI